MIMKKRTIGYLCLLAFSLALLPDIIRAQTEAYDPLKVPDSFKPEILDLTVKDAKRNREIPLRIYLPSGQTDCPVVLFSHGLGGSCMNNPYLGNHWAARGYAAVFVQHPGSDTPVWQDQPPEKRMKALKKAASAKNFLLRVKDISAVLDQIEKWNASANHPLYKRLNLEQIGMSGHSFGAVTTQAVSGQCFRGKSSYTDLRIKAAVAFSPSSPRRGSAEKAFEKVQIPWMLMTGTKDLSPIGERNKGVREK
jgi:predicted dienelactone hydrolase